MNFAIQGYLDTCNADGVSGWAWAASLPDCQILIDCYIDGMRVYSTPTFEQREDLRAAGIGNGRHGFRFRIPPALYDQQKHKIEVLARHGPDIQHLIGSPTEFCLGPLDLVIGDYEIGSDGLVQGWVIDNGEPSRASEVIITAHGVGEITVPATLYRSDLRHNGDGSGRHGFQAVLPAAWYKVETLAISVREKQSGKELANQPSVFNTANSYLAWIRNQEMAWRTSPVMSNPLISVLMPVYNPPPALLSEAIESVLKQSYGNWQLCIADDASTAPEIRDVLSKYAEVDRRIHVKLRKKNGHISRASNSALAFVQGSYVALLDHDDLLHPHALGEVARVIDQHPGAGIIFSDEDKCDEHGVRYGPYLKSAWDSELLLGQNCISHLGVYSTALVRRVGGFRVGYEGSQDYDLALRISRLVSSAQIHHIPKVLYHWRAIPGSTALDNAEKKYASLAMHKALRSHLRALDTGATSEPAVNGVFCRVIWPRPSTRPSLTLMLLFAHLDKQRNLLRQLTEIQWPNLQVIIAQAPAIDSRSASYEHRLRCHKSMLENAAGDICLWLEEAAPVGELGSWLDELVVHALRADVGLAGPKLIDRESKIVSAGWTFEDPQDRTSYAPLFGGLPAADPGPNGKAGLCRSVSMLAPNVFVAKRSALQAILARLPEESKAPDMAELSRVARQLGWKTIVTPFAMAVVAPDSADVMKQ
jgi:hypothetical protein